MEGKCVRCELQGISNRSRRHTFGAGLDKQPEYVEAIVLCERRQGLQSTLLFHTSILIEIKLDCQVLFR